MDESTKSCGRVVSYGQALPHANSHMHPLPAGLMDTKASSSPAWKRMASQQDHECIKGKHWKRW